MKSAWDLLNDLHRIKTLGKKCPKELFEELQARLLDIHSLLREHSEPSVHSLGMGLSNEAKAAAERFINAFSKPPHTSRYATGGPTAPTFATDDHGKAL